MLKDQSLLEAKTLEAKRLWQRSRTIEIKVLIAKALMELGAVESTAWQAADTIDMDGGRGLLLRLDREGVKGKEIEQILIYLKEFSDNVYPSIKWG